VSTDIYPSTILWTSTAFGLYWIMFKKKPRIKNLSQLRSSDRRKLADQIIADYRVHVPLLQEIDPTANLEAASASAPSPALTSTRACLLPETCHSARFTTVAGANATPVSGTVYVGAHPNQEERILWIQYGRETRLYPTVYTLWHNPGLVPLLHTQDFVVEKLQTGADLMTPGLVGGPPWPAAAKKGSVVAVAGLEKPTVPVWVGVCKIDICDLGPVQGAKGAAVEGVHWEGDEIWNWSQTGGGGRPAPQTIEDWEEGSPAAVEEGVTKLALEDHEEDEEAQEEEEEGGVPLEVSTPELLDGRSRDAHDRTTAGQDEKEEPTPEDKEPEHEPTTAEVDQAFLDAFLYAVYNAKKNGGPPHYGLDFPLQPSYLISNMIQPHLRIQNQQYYNIKKTSWKNTKKFIKHLDKAMLLKSKDRNGGETVILDIDFDDERVKGFTPYRLPPSKASSATNDGGDAPASGPSAGADASIDQKLSLITVYRASAKLVPDLLPSKSTFYTSRQISTFLKTYIENSPSLTTQTSSPRHVKLDPFIANNILGSNRSGNDNKILAVGEITKDALFRRVIDDDHLCIPHWLLLRDGQQYDTEHPDPGLKPKAGPPPTASIVIEKRTGTKVVTKISGLEVFGIHPQLLGPELQKKCAGSASVGQLAGGKPGMLEILVQGDQRDVVEKELARRGVDRKWIDVTDKTKKAKGQGSGGGRK